jgi:hypothetical protein
MGGIMNGKIGVFFSVAAVLAACSSDSDRAAQITQEKQMIQTDLIAFKLEQPCTADTQCVGLYVGTCAGGPSGYLPLSTLTPNKDLAMVKADRHKVLSYELLLATGVTPRPACIPLAPPAMACVQSACKISDPNYPAPF